MKGCIKTLIKFSAQIVTAIGLVVIAFGFYVLYKQVGLNYNQLYYNSAEWIRTLQEYGFIILGILIFIMGSSGMHATKKKKPACKRPCLLIYEIGAIFFFLLFSSLAIFTLVYSDDIFGTECTNTDYFKDVDDLIQGSKQYFCSNQCECYIEQAVAQRNPQKFEGKVYTTVEADDNKIKIQDCDDFSNSFNKYTAGASMMSAAENLLKCTGWCEPTQYFIFSNINNEDYTDESCFIATKDLVERGGKISGYVLLGLAILFLLNVILVLFLCCMKDKSKTNYYKNLGGQ